MLMGAQPVRGILHLSYCSDVPSYQQPFLVWRITLCVSVWPEFPEHSRRHTTMDVGKSSPNSLSNIPFFFLLASEPGNFGRKECHSQTELDRRLAVCQAGLGLIPVCYGRERETNLFISCKMQWIQQNSALFLLLFANVTSDLGKAPAGSLMAKPTCVSLPSLACDHLLYP